MNKNTQYKKLTDICEIITGEWGTEITENSQNIVSVIRTTNFLNNGKIDIQNKELIKREIDQKKIEQKQLKRRDIIIEKSGGSPNQPVGRVIFFDLNSNDEVFLCNNFTSILRVKEDINSKYIFYFLRNSYKKNKVVKFQNKTTGIINLKLQNYLNESYIFLPELKIQNKIVNILDKLEDIIEKNHNYLTHLGVLTKSLFTRMFGDIKTNDKNWEIKKLKELVEIKSFIINENLNSIWLLNLEDIEPNTGKLIKKREVSFKNIPSSTISFNENYVLYSKLRPYLNKVFLPDEKGFGTSELVPLLPKKNIHKIFLTEYLRNDKIVDFLSQKVSGAKMPRVIMKEFQDLNLILPPIELQNKFAERIEKIEKLKFIIWETILKVYKTPKKKGVENN